MGTGTKHDLLREAARAIASRPCECDEPDEGEAGVIVCDPCALRAALDAPKPTRCPHNEEWAEPLFCADCVDLILDAPEPVCPHDSSNPNPGEYECGLCATPDTVPRDVADRMADAIEAGSNGNPGDYARMADAAAAYRAATKGGSHV